ncbi:MAG: mechanosensitive ion channel family protein [Haloarculaceae archaeon]
MQEAGTLVEQGRQLLEQLTTTEGRLAVSAGLVVVAVAIAVLVTPLLVRQTHRLLAARFGSGRAADAVDLVGEYMPTSFTEVVLRTVQVAILVLAVLSLLVVWGLIGVAQTLVTYLLGAVPNLVNLLLTVALLLAMFIGSDQLRNAIERLSAGGNRITEHQQEIMLRVGQLALFVTGGAAILTLWGVNLGGLLVGAGFLGIVVGFAARQTLGSLIAGFVLMFSRPFTVGDWIEVDGREGIVTDITIVNTRIENFDGEFVVIPNDRVSNRAVTNRSRKGLLRLKIDVGIDYDADPERAEEVALETMGDIEQVVDSPPPQVIPKSFGDSAIVLELRFWIDHPTPPRKWQAVSAVVREVKAAFDEAGIKIPYPQRELSGRAETGGFRIHGEGEGVVPEPAADPEHD